VFGGMAVSGDSPQRQSRADRIRAMQRQCAANSFVTIEALSEEVALEDKSFKLDSIDYDFAVLS